MSLHQLNGIQPMEAMCNGR